jgi:hypothetical protein
MTDLVVLIPLRGERASDVRDRVARALDRGGLLNRYIIGAPLAVAEPEPTTNHYLEERFEP